MLRIVFTIMLLNIRVDASKNHSHKILIGSILGFFMLINTLYLLAKSRVAPPNGTYTSEIIQKIGHTELIGREMFTNFLLPFEVTSILLLVAIVGAVVLAKKKL